MSTHLRGNEVNCVLKLAALNPCVMSGPRFLTSRMEKRIELSS